MLHVYNLYVYIYIHSFIPIYQYVRLEWKYQSIIMEIISSNHGKKGTVPDTSSCFWTSPKHGVKLRSPRKPYQLNISSDTSSINDRTYTYIYIYIYIHI